MSGNETMKVKNVTGETFEMQYPIHQTFLPGEVVEVTYSLGEDLIGRLEFDKAEVKGIKKASKKKVK